MTDRRHRLGVVGLGNRSRTILRAAVASGRFDVVAVSDGWEDPQQPPGPGRQDAPDAQYVPDWRELLEQDIDAVAVVVPNDRHVAVVRAALTAGLHVLCEKPLAVTASEVAALLEDPDAGGRLYVGMELRHAPAVQDLLARTAPGALPGPDLVWAQEFRPPFRPGAHNWRLDPARSGGTLVEKSCHHFDLFCLLLGDRPVAVSAVGTGAGGLLHHASVSVRFGNGAAGSLALSMTMPGQRLRLGASGSGWGYEYDSCGEVSRFVDADGEAEQRWAVDTRGVDAGGWDHPGEVEQLQAFAAQIDGEPDALAARTSPLWGHLVAFAAERAIREDRVVRIEADGSLR